MKIRGIATIKKYRTYDGITPAELIEEVTKENIINKRVMTILYDNTPNASDNVFEPQLRIAVSSTAIAEDYELQTMGSVTMVGDPTAIATPYVFTDRVQGVSPAQIVYTNRFVPPAVAFAPRVINSLAITSNSTGTHDASPITANTFTQLVLGVPINQADNEILDISYKIFVDWQNSPLGATESYQRKIEWRLFDRDQVGTSNLDGHLLNTAISWFPSKYSYYPQKNLDSNTLWRRFGFSTNFLSQNVDPPPFSTENPAYADVEYGRWAFKWGEISGDNSLVNDILGYPSRGILFGEPRPGRFDNDYYATADITNSSWPELNTDAPHYHNDWNGFVPWNKTNNLSTLWSHAEDATAWMYDVNSLANSSWQPTITENVVTKDFHSAYYLRVVTAGGISVGEYKLYKDGFSDYGNNDQETQRIFPAMWTVGANTTYNLDPTDETIIWNARWIYSWEKGVDSFKYATFRRNAGVALWDLTSEDHTEINTFPLSIYTQFGSTINDIDVYPAGNIIYVATEAGLYEITSADTSPVVNQLSADACASVAVGLGGQAYAIFRDGATNGRLSTGPSWSTAIDAATLDANVNWDNVWRIWIDPISATFDLMIYEGPAPKHQPYENTATLPHVGIYRIHWCNNGGYLSTSSFNNVQGVAGTGIDCYTMELVVLPTNHTVQVTNGVWVYPTNMYPAGDVFENRTSPNQQWGQIQNNSDNGGLCLDMLIDFKGPSNINGLRAANNSTLGWNVGITEVNKGTLYPFGMSKGYAFGKHNVAPFFTANFDGGTMSELIVGKPSPGATTYELGFFMCWQEHLRDFQTISGIADADRIPMRFKLDVDEAGSSTLTDYSAVDIKYHYGRQEDEYWHFTKANIVVGDDTSRKTFWFAQPRIGTLKLDVTTQESPDPLGRFWEMKFHCDGGIGIVNLMCDTSNGGDFDDIFVQAYDWTGSAWVPGTPSGAGKPIHLAAEDLIDGLRVSWADLQPGNSQDLIVDQWYNFVKMTEPSSILAETTSPTLSGQYDFYLREMVTGFDSGTIPVGLTITLDEAPTGASSDALWLSMPPDNEGQNLSATINGSAVPVIIDPSTTPSAGTIHITDTAAGTVYFAAADSGQPFTLNYVYLRKYDQSEVL